MQELKATSLCDLPEELILEILENYMHERQDLASLSLTCGKLHRIVEPLLYRHVELKPKFPALPFLMRTLLRRPDLAYLVKRLDVDGSAPLEAGDTHTFDLEHWSKAFDPKLDGVKTPDLLLLEAAYESRSEACNLRPPAVQSSIQPLLLHYPMFNLLLLLLSGLADLRLVNVPSHMIGYPGIRQRERFPEAFSQHAFNSITKVSYLHCYFLALGYSEPWASDIPNVKEISVDPGSLSGRDILRLAFPVDNIERINICHNYYERRRMASLIKYCRNLKSLGISFEFPWHFSTVGNNSRPSRCIQLLAEALLDRIDTLQYLRLKFDSHSRAHFSMKHEDMAPLIRSLGKLENLKTLEMPTWIFDLDLYESPSPRVDPTAIVQSLLPASLKQLVLNHVDVSSHKIGTAIKTISSNAKEFWPRLREIRITESARECESGFRTESRFRESSVGKLAESCLKDSGIILSFEAPDRDRDLERVCCYPKGFTL